MATNEPDKSTKAGDPPGKQASADDLMPIVYEEMRRLASAYLSRDSGDGMLEPASLVNETYLRLAHSPPGSWEDIDHFRRVAAMAMRKVLIDQARRRRALKRGFGRARVSLELVTANGTREIDIRTLDEALRQLAKIDERAAEVVELRFFGGLTHDQAARVMGVSRKTAVKHWIAARDWLAAELSQAGMPTPAPGHELNGYAGQETDSEDD